MSLQEKFDIEREEGREEGRAEGCAEGMKKGLERGLTEGRAEGRKEMRPVIKAAEARADKAEAELLKLKELLRLNGVAAN